MAHTCAGAHTCTQACVLYSLLRRGMGIGSPNQPCTHALYTPPHAYTRTCRTHMQVRTHLHRLVSFILFFGGGWASAFQTSHAHTYCIHLMHHIPAMHPCTLALRSPPHANTHMPHTYAGAHTNTQAGVLYPLLRRGMGIGFPYPPFTHVLFTPLPL